MLFRESRSIGGILNVVTIYKHSKRDIYLITYNPVNQKLFHLLAEADLRAYIESALNTEVLVTKNYLLNQICVYFVTN